jgi:hypothetical protein
MMTMPPHRRVSDKKDTMLLICQWREATSCPPPGVDNLHAVQSNIYTIPWLIAMQSSKHIPWSMCAIKQQQLMFYRKIVAAAQ